MGLLAPLFLLGALAVAIPVLVHLVHKERKEPLAFPSLMFLRRVPFRSARRQRIRYWLLFLMRSLALILIAAAFARPWLKKTDAATGTHAGGKDIVLMIDRSYSMSARGVWDRAQRAAANVLAGAAANDRVAVIGFGEQAELLARLDEPRARAQLALQTVEPSRDVTRYAPAFKLAGNALGRARGSAEIVVITDRQRSGWRGVEQVPVPQGTTVRVIDVRSEAVRNVAVTDVQLARSLYAGRQRVVPGARVVNRGAAAASVRVELRIDNRVQQMRTVQVAPHGTTNVQFEAMFTTAAAGDVRVTAGDDVAADDIAYFTTDAQSAPSVRLVSGSAESAFYFQNALTAGDEAAFSIRRADAQLSPADLVDGAVVVFLDAQLPSGQSGERLIEFVRQGGGVVIAGIGSMRGELAPVRNVSAQERSQAPATLVAIDAAHPVFEAFRSSGAEAFAAARITRHARSEPVADATVIARFDDGSPALVERRLGRGRILYFASSFSRGAGDLVLQPAFVPFAQQLVRHAGAGAQVARAYTVGQVADVNAFAPGESDAVVITPARERLRYAPASGARTLRLSEPGIYQIRSTGAGAATQLIAANVDVAESDLSALDAKLFADAIAPGDQNFAAAAAAPLLPTDREQQQSVWWYLLFTAFALLAVETLIGNRISTAWRT
jgi:hypothetical protein